MLAANGKDAYYSSVRSDSYGEKDLYHITFLQDTTKEVEPDDQPFLTLLKGVITDEKTKEPLADAWGALFAGELLVESADLSNVSKVHRAKLERVQEWQRHILRSDTLPAVERALASNTLAELAKFTLDRNG